MLRLWGQLLSATKPGYLWSSSYLDTNIGVSRNHTKAEAIHGAKSIDIIQIIVEMIWERVHSRERSLSWSNLLLISEQLSVFSVPRKYPVAFPLFVCGLRTEDCELRFWIADENPTKQIPLMRRDMSHSAQQLKHPQNQTVAGLWRIEPSRNSQHTSQLWPVEKQFQVGTNTILRIQSLMGSCIHHTRTMSCLIRTPKDQKTGRLE